MPEPSARPGPAKMVLFASGDFACNLYWQSITLFLFYFYTEHLRLPPATAGLIYAAGALWDGIADLAVGIAAQRSRAGYRRFVALGSLPLGLTFIALYITPSGSMAIVAASALAAQIGFRTLYAIVNVPYAAWSTRISQDSDDRATIAGLRMIFGTAAVMAVAVATPWLAAAFAPAGYAIAAALFAAVAVPLLLVVANRTPEARHPAPALPIAVTTSLAALARNRAFVTLNAAMAAAGVAAAVVAHSMLYYFAHVVGDPAGGPRALAVMAVAGALAVPAWMAVARGFGTRLVWLAAAAIGLAAIAVLAAGAPALAAMIGLQTAFTGCNLVFWAMLPDTVDWGEAQSGLRIEATAFGAAALIQKAGLAAAAGLVGVLYSHVGYTGGGGVQQVATIDGIRAVMLAVPAVGLALSIAAMLANPLRHGVHARLMRDRQA